jgi:hypothetical protein
MSYPGLNEINSEGAFAVGGIGGAIVSARGGLTTDMVLGQLAGNFTMGETSGPNAVNPSGRANGVRHAIQGIKRSK